MSKLRPPDLHEWINKYGGYHAIDWKAWHDANAEYQQQRRDQLVLDLQGRSSAPPKRKTAP